MTPWYGFNLVIFDTHGILFEKIKVISQFINSPNHEMSNQDNSLPPLSSPNHRRETVENDT